MAGLGITATDTLIVALDNTQIVIPSTRVRKGKTANSSQDTYADGSTDVTPGYSTSKVIRVHCERLTPADIRFLDDKVGEALYFSGARGNNFIGLLDDYDYDQIASEATGYEYHVVLIFILVDETVDEFLERIHRRR